MGLNDTPNSERTRISFFGRTNAGKSSLVNALTNQSMSMVSEVKGTTTDPVSKAMELLPLGPVLITDTAGLDDVSELGEMRIARTMEILEKTDIAVLVTDINNESFSESENEIIGKIKAMNIPLVIVRNKCDTKTEAPNKDYIYTSAEDGTGIDELKNKLGEYNKPTESYLVRDMLKKDDVVILVTPIDESAPKVRMILPQQMMIRDILDADAICIVVKDSQYVKALEQYPEPRMVITDSQAFGFVSKNTPKNIPLTSFSILMARYKGFLRTAAEGCKALKNIKDGDRILIAEGCTHHRQCNDIGTVQLPKKICAYTGAKPEFVYSSGNGFPSDLSEFSLIVHCGGCMITERDVLNRMNKAIVQGVPFTNYGILLAECNGIFERSTEGLL